MYVIELPSFVLIAEGVDCVADKPKLEWNILGLGNFKIFWGNNGPLLTLSVTLIKPAGYFNCYSQTH